MTRSQKANSQKATAIDLTKNRYIGKDGTAFSRSEPEANDFEPVILFPPKILPALENSNSMREIFNYFINDFVINKIIHYTNKRIPDISIF